jgi:DNA-binding response OmpR family regulator
MQPKTLALIDDDAEYSEFLAQFLQEQGIAVSRSTTAMRCWPRRRPSPSTSTWST